VFLSDQHAGRPRSVDAIFRAACVTRLLPALLAKRTRARANSAGVTTPHRARWRMVFTERFDQTGASVAVLTSKINQVIEQQIRRAPEDWFWVHIVGKRLSPNFSSRALQTRHLSAAGNFGS